MTPLSPSGSPIPFVGMILSLRGISRHGENRIKQHGHRWEVRSIDAGAGKLLLRSMHNTFQNGESFTPDLRWVLLVNDPHFEVIIR